MGLTIVLVLSSLAAASGLAAGSSAVPDKALATPYDLTFTETGLPAGTNWSVHAAFVGCGCEGVHKTVTSNTSTVTIPVTNGTYKYNVLRVGGYYVTVAASGSLNVSGSSPSAVALVFYPLVPFTVEFTESGLPSASLWTVSVTGNGHGQERAYEDLTESSYGSSMNFSLPNGTYHYTVAQVAGSFFVSNAASHGKFVVAGGSPAPILVGFLTPATFAVTFNESGLPNGMNWSVRVNGWGGAPVHEALSSTTGNITFQLPNGSYRFAVSEVLGFMAPSPVRGSLSVAGSAVEVDVSYVPVVQGAFYPIAFEENGLPAGTSWAVTVTLTHTFGHSRKEVQSSTDPTLFVLLQNGTYRYQVHGVRGYTISSGDSGAFAVAGSSPSVILVNFTLIPTYTVTFTESGLANATNWSVLVRSQSAGSTLYPIHTVTTGNNTTITFSVPNGTYCYRVLGVPGYRLTAGNATGSLTVAGAPPAGVTVGFTAKA